MNSLFKKLEQKKLLISDGAWGTMLHQKGLTPGNCPEEWNVSHPEQVKSIAKAYIEAGAEIILPLAVPSLSLIVMALKKVLKNLTVPELNCPVK
jgi:S-methylmethionine-dependent homocysteine/selenocysteine methylase